MNDRPTTQQFPDYLRNGELRLAASYRFDPSHDEDGATVKIPIQALAQVIDDSILQSYKLWPTNYIAYDILNQSDFYKDFYTENEKSLFERRLEMRIDENHPIQRAGFLAMYANPVLNKSKYENAI